MAHEASGSTTTPVFDPTVAPEQRTDGQGPAAAPLQTGEPAVSVGSVSLVRLLSVAALTPAQASVVAVKVLDAAATRASADGQRLVGGSLGAVTFTSSGDIEVAAPHADGGMPVTELLKRLVQNARRLPTHPKPEQLLLLDRLEEAARNPLHEPGTWARDLERALAETLGPCAWQRLSGQLAELVDAAAHVATGVADPIDPRPSATRPATRHTSGRPPRRPSQQRRRTRNRRMALVVVVVAALLAGTAYVVLGGPGVKTLESLGRGSHAAAPARPAKQSAKDSARNPQAPVLAPRHAGPITRVSVHKTARCKPGARCPVRVAVHFRPASSTRAISWKVGSARLCTQGIAWSARTTVTARPGWRTVHASSSVRVPKGRSLALIALTVAPARAQSRPVPVAGSSRHC